MRFDYKLGIFLALATVIFSGLSNFINKFALTAVGDPLIHTTLKNTIVALMIISTLIIAGKIKKLKSLSRSDIWRLLIIGIVGGSLPFYLFFSGLAQMSAVNAALIHKTLIFWVALLAVPFLGERVSAVQMAALGIIFSANLVVGGFNGFSFNTPELMILLATMLWAAENVIAKITLKRIDPDILVAARMGIGSMIMLVAVFLSGKTVAFFSLDARQLGLIATTSALLYGYVSTWYRALRVAPVTLVATVLTLATLITNILSAIFVTHELTFQQLFQFGLIATGLLIFIAAFFKQSKSEKTSFRLSR